MKCNWEEKKIGDLVDIRRGASPRPIHKYLAETGVPWVKIADATADDSRYISKTKEYIINEGICKSVEVEPETLIVSNSATPGLPKIMKIKACVHDGWLVFSNYRGITRDFLYYKFIYIRKMLLNQANGSVFQNLKTDIVKDFDIRLPCIDIQNKIVDILLKIDEKIELNNKINNNLEEQAKALYQSYFSPKSELQGKTVTLDEYCSIFTGKKNANASIDEGKYKFFTCAPDALQIDSYIFDGNAIIVSGNGAYTGRTRFYSGKFDLYQRTYACTLYDNINPDFIFPLYWFVKLELSKKIKGGTRGSAIPYIIMNDLAKFEFIYNDKLFKTFIPTFKSITETIQANELENEVLTSLRDTLLPKLMSGEIDVSNISI